MEIERKQTSLDALRAQLKEVKDLNIVMLGNLQVCLFVWCGI